MSKIIKYMSLQNRDVIFTKKKKDPAVRSTTLHRACNLHNLRKKRNLHSVRLRKITCIDVHWTQILASLIYNNDS